MTASVSDIPRAARSRPYYGIDAPAVPVLNAAAGAACCLAAARWRRARIPLAMAGAVPLAFTAVYLHTTLRGKLRVWEQILDTAGLSGDERLLDMGCGRGAVLIAAARRLPAGQAVGADLWSTTDQSGNSREATLANAAAAGVSGRVDVHTADITALPFADDSFDVVTSALVIHNIAAQDRYRALDEAMRVLRPGGLLLIADLWPTVRSYAAHLGYGTVRGLGPRYWYGPLVSVCLLRAVKGD